MYHLVQEAKKTNFVTLHENTFEPLKSVTKHICTSTGSILRPSQIIYSYLYGGKEVFFEKEDIDTMKLLSKPCLRLLGFKPRTALKDYHNLKHSIFIYPDDYQIKGSIVAFSAILDRMLALDKIAICKFSARNNNLPSMVALLPQREETHDDSSQKTPPGFHLIHLPFAEDIRNPNIEKQPSADTDQILKAKMLVKKLRIVFDSTKFENPALQKHYASLQDVALERKELEEVPDYVTPDEEGMMRFKKIITEFKDSVFPPNYEPNPKSKPAKNVGKKRKREEPTSQESEANGSTKGTKRRKVTTEEKNAATTGRNWERLVADDEIKNLRIPELRAYLKINKVRGYSKLNKMDLVEAVTAHIREGGKPIKKEKVSQKSSDSQSQSQNSTDVKNTQSQSSSGLKFPLVPVKKEKTPSMDIDDDDF
eukprot:TRINITY_DN3189_c0_g1_i8.p1 TRINITY_DN3189_c0_g1~~TRINITY_DN3189_c0_g1_i8.p1  ORF type:complete len:423 (+),score=69.93 TRINITY_DN3189_c0_g1_i8:321-1589(+)